MNSISELITIPFVYAPFLCCLVIITAFAIILSPSIKKHASVYYGIFSIPILLHLIQGVLMLFGSPFSLYGIPVVEHIMEFNSHMVYFGYPLLVVIMYTGALNPKNRYAKRLLVIRKELSIISGFPVLTHSLIRIIYTLPGSIRYFTDHTDYVRENDWIRNTIGVGISSFGYILGIAMVVVFLVLWITSFKSVHKRMGNRKWKKLHKWSYVLYAMIFVHSITLNIGWTMNGEYEGENVNQIARGIIAIASTTLVFTSYLILRLRKAANERKK